MLEDAQRTIYEMIVKDEKIKGSLIFLKSGKISVHIPHLSKKRMHFRKLIDILELIED